MNQREYEEALQRYCLADAMLMSHPPIVVRTKMTATEAQALRGKSIDMLIMDDVEAAASIERQRRKMATFALAYGATPQQAQRAAQAAINLPKEPNMTPTEQLKQAEAALVAAQKAVIEQEEREAFQARVDRDIALANATVTLLNRIATDTPSAANPSFAKFRNELQPLANSYGYKIVLIGDKSAAALVKV